MIFFFVGEEWEVMFLLTAIADQGCTRAGSRVGWQGYKVKKEEIIWSKWGLMSYSTSVVWHIPKAASRKK